MKKLFTALIVLLIAGVLAVYLLLPRLLDAPLGVSDPQVLNVASGSSIIRLGNQLGEAAIVPYPQVWVWYARLSGKAAQIQAGEYALEPDMTSRQLLDNMVAGKVLLHRFTILEGWTVWQLLDNLAAFDALENTLPDDIGVETLGNQLGLSYEHAEGLFYPDTYSFPRGTTDSELLLIAASRLQAELDEAWTGRAPESVIANPYQLLTLASIVERETAVDDERPEIAGVFVNRLYKRMRLQTDPTVIYGIGKDFNGNITSRDLKTDTPYNTYTRGGLPPTPISLPARASLQAAAHPASTAALYFVATGDGSGRHVFSETLEEHNRAVAAYLKQLRLQRQKNR